MYTRTQKQVCKLELCLKTHTSGCVKVDTLKTTGSRDNTLLSIFSL